MNAARNATIAPEAAVSSIAGLTAMVTGSNHKIDEAAPATKAPATNTNRIRKP